MWFWKWHQSIQIRPWLWRILPSRMIHLILSYFDLIYLTMILMVNRFNNPHCCLIIKWQQPITQNLSFFARLVVEPVSLDLVSKSMLGQLTSYQRSYASSHVFAQSLVFNHHILFDHSLDIALLIVKTFVIYFVIIIVQLKKLI